MPRFLVVANQAVLLGAAMLLPLAAARPGPAQVAAGGSAAPSTSPDPSASPLADATVVLESSDFELTEDWAIAVTGGVASVDVVNVPSGDVGGFTVNVIGESATVEMTAKQPPGWQLTMSVCTDLDNQVPGGSDALVAPRQLVLEVVPGGSYECIFQSGPGSGAADDCSVRLTPQPGRVGEQATLIATGFTPNDDGRIEGDGAGLIPDGGDPSVTFDAAGMLRRTFTVSPSTVNPVEMGVFDEKTWCADGMLWNLIASPPPTSTAAGASKPPSGSWLATLAVLTAAITGGLLAWRRGRTRDTAWPRGFALNQGHECRQVPCRPGSSFRTSTTSVRS
jgi:hypothetical protein